MISGERAALPDAMMRDEVSLFSCFDVEPSCLLEVVNVELFRRLHPDSALLTDHAIPTEVKTRYTVYHYDPFPFEPSQLKDQTQKHDHDSCPTHNPTTSTVPYSMIMLAHQDLQEDKWANVSPLRWKSWKLACRTRSTLGAELMGVSRALAEGDWIRSLFAEALNASCRLSDDMVLRKKIPMMTVTDNKPIYDHCLGDGVVVKDKRMAIDMLVVRSHLRSQNVSLRWVDTRQMVVDSLTKISANPDLSYFVLRYGRFICVAENVSLQLNAQEREQKRVLHTSKKGCVKRTHSGEDTSR